MEAFLIQEIEHVESGEKLDLAFMLEATIIESMDLTGPKFIAEFDDSFAIIRDDMGVKEGDELRITIADIFERDGIDEIIDFKILTMPMDGDNIQINAMASLILALKTRSAKGRVFNKKPPSNIIGQMFKGVKVDAKGFPVVEDYHLLAGEYPSYMLRQMAMEQGGHLFLDRGTVSLYKLDDIMKKSQPDFTYHNGEIKGEENIIRRYAIPSTQHVLEDKMIRRYSGWNMTRGWQSVGDISLPPEGSATQSKITMGNLAKVQKPAIDFVCQGNGFLRAGSCIDFVWNTLRADSPLDESLPERVVAFTVAHNYASNNYYTRVKGVIPLERRQG